MLAYYETVRSGLVPCKVTRMVRAVRGELRIWAKVTGPRSGYARGDTIESTGLHMVPRHAVRRRRYSTIILAYDWAAEASRAGFRIEAESQDAAARRGP